jgi:hypothetical protein
MCIRASVSSPVIDRLKMHDTMTEGRSIRANVSSPGNDTMTNGMSIRPSVSIPGNLQMKNVPMTQ